MRSYYLVPEAAARRLSERGENRGASPSPHNPTPPPPPLIKAGKRKKKKKPGQRSGVKPAPSLSLTPVPTIYETPNGVNERPSLNSQIESGVSNVKRSGMSALLNNLRKNSLLEWDSEGQLLNTGFHRNILDLLRDATSKKGNISGKKRSELASILSLSNIPRHYLQSPGAQGVLKGYGLTSGNVRGKGRGGRCGVRHGCPSSPLAARRGGRSLLPSAWRSY